MEFQARPRIASIKVVSLEENLPPLVQTENLYVKFVMKDFQLLSHALHLQHNHYTHCQTSHTPENFQFHITALYKCDIL